LQCKAIINFYLSEELKQMSDKRKKNKLLALSFVLLALLAATLALAELTDGFFTSNVDLQDLLEMEAVVVTKMTNYIDKEEQRMRKLKG